MNDNSNVSENVKSIWNDECQTDFCLLKEIFLYL